MTYFGQTPRTVTLLRPEDITHSQSPYPKGNLAWAADNHWVIIVWITWPELDILNGKKQTSRARVPCDHRIYKFDGVSGSKLQERDVSSSLGVAHLSNGYASAKH